jgi:hypothetical protein
MTVVRGSVSQCLRIKLAVFLSQLESIDEETGMVALSCKSCDIAGKYKVTLKVKVLETEDAPDDGCRSATRLTPSDPNSNILLNFI